MAHPANRIPMDTTRYYLGEEIFDKCKQHYAPNNTVFLEFAPNRFIRTNNDHEVKFACEVVARSHADFHGVDVDSRFHVYGPEASEESAGPIRVETEEEDMV